MTTPPGYETLRLDVAMLSQDYSSLVLYDIKQHTIELDEIIITTNDFKKIFYSYGEQFGINDSILKNPTLYGYISFSPPYRTIEGGKPFSLLEKMITNIELDLNVGRNSFSRNSFIEFSKEITNIKTLAHINCCNILASLSWPNIVSIIKNDYITRQIPLTEVVLVVSVVFKTPNPSIQPNTVKFNYRIKQVASFF
jgi:hypothetical protein